MGSTRHGVYVAGSAPVKPGGHAQPFVTALLCHARSSSATRPAGFKRNHRFEVWSCVAQRLYAPAANP